MLKPKNFAIEIKKQDGKGKAESAGASFGAIAAGGKQKPSLAPKSKTPAIEVKKQNGKGKAEAANSGEDWPATARSGRQVALARKSYRLRY
jgi:hypothetical protein